jgi:IMP cyclohydrolase
MVKIDGLALHDIITEGFFGCVNKEQIEEICLAAVMQNGNALQFISNDRQTEAICLAAVSQNGLALKYTRDHLLTKEMCIIAISRNAFACQYIGKFKSEEMYMLAIKESPSILMWLDEEWKTEAVCITAVSIDSYYLLHIDKQTDAICLAAVLHNGDMLQYVDIQTEEICLAAVSQDPHALKYTVNLPKRKPYRQTDAMCLTAVISDGITLEHVKIQTEKICLTAVMSESHAIVYVERVNFPVCSMALCDYKVRKWKPKYGMNLPTIYHKWFSYPESRDIVYYKSNLTSAKKYTDIWIKLNYIVRRQKNDRLY